MLNLPAALQVVLSTHEVPHKVAPVHPVQLVGEEELDVLPLCRHVYHDHITTLVIGYLVPLNILPSLVLARMERTVHAREKHILRILILHAARNLDVGVFLIRRCLLLADKLGAIILDARFAVTVLHVQGHLRAEGRSVEERTRTILLTSQVLT